MSPGAQLEFNELGECERCRKERLICRTGICQPCLAQILEIRSFAPHREKRLRDLKSAETGLLMSIRRRMTMETHQQPPEMKLSFTRLLNERDQRKAMQIALRDRLARIMEASPERSLLQDRMISSSLNSTTLMML